MGWASVVEWLLVPYQLRNPGLIERIARSSGKTWGRGLGAPEEDPASLKSVADRIIVTVTELTPCCSGAIFIGFGCYMRNMSPVWKQIVCTVGSGEVSRFIGMLNFAWKVGCGERVLFWLDPWCVDDALRDVFHRLYSLAVNKFAMVVDYSVQGLFALSDWLSFFRRELRSFEVGFLRELVSLVLPISIRVEVMDTLIWKPDEHGCFSVRKLSHNLLLEWFGDGVYGECFVWKVPVPTKEGQGPCVWCHAHEDALDHILYSFSR
ncbi:hypothetical protein GQ457_02G032240 [Hibiscus cannabinus]